MARNQLRGGGATQPHCTSYFAATVHQLRILCYSLETSLCYSFVLHTLVVYLSVSFCRTRRTRLRTDLQRDLNIGTVMRSSPASAARESFSCSFWPE